MTCRFRRRPVDVQVRAGTTGQENKEKNMQTISLSTTARPATSARSQISKRAISRGGALLWTIQGALAVTFVFAGLTKLAAPGAAADSSNLPVMFMAFIGICEVLGGVGLVLPGITRIRPGLTPLAAAGLLVVMVGATTVTAVENSVALAMMPFAVGVLALLVAYRRAPSGIRQARFF